MGVRVSRSPGDCDCLSVLDKSVSLLNNFDRKFYKNESERLSALKTRFAEGTLNLAVLGQFKRGKSTLLNSLLGADVLPSSVVPLTAIPTFVKRGKSFSVSVLFNSDRESLKLNADSVSELKGFLADFVTEEKNPENKKEVREVEISIPDNPLLDKRVVLIDTPGIGSTYKHNTEATLNFLPQCDAALFVLSADPPITEVEVDFLKKVEEKVPRLFFVLNKVDYLDSDEIREVSSFLIKTLRDAGIENEIKIFPVSAKLALKGKISNNEELIRKSGIKEIEEHLIGFLAEEKTKALAEAVAVKVSQVLNEVLLNTELELKSLEMPLKVLEEKMRFFEQSIEQIKNEKYSALDVLEGDRKRIHALLEEYCVELKERALSFFEGILQEEISISSKSAFNEANIRKRFSEVIPLFFEREMGEAVDLFENKVNELLNKHKERANGLIKSLKETAADLFNVSYGEMKDNGFFRLVRKPYWVSHKWNAVFSPIPPAVVDKVLPLKVRNNRVLKRMREQIQSLTVFNIENLRWSIYQSIDDSFRAFVNLLEEKFETTLQSTYGAVKEVFEKKKEKQEKFDFDSEKLEKTKKTLNALLSELTEFRKKSKLD